MDNENFGKNNVGEDSSSVEDILELISTEALLAANGKFDEQIKAMEERDVLRESIYDDEKFLNDPNYLLMLNDAIFKNIADGELLDCGIVRKENVAIIDIDIPNSTAGLEAALEKFEEEDINRTSDIKAVEEHILLLMTVHDVTVEVFRLYGIKGDNFFADGSRGLCEGGVHQAKEAAELIKKKLSEHGLNVRIGIDIGDVTVIGCGDESNRKAFMTGDVVKGAEVVQKNAEVGEVALSVSAQEAVLTQSDETIFDWEKLRELSLTPGEIKSEIEAREAFLPASRIRELRHQYLSGKEPRPSINEVCTLVIDLPDIENREFGDANKIVSEIFRIVAASGGEVDKMDGKRIMANFVAGRSDFDGVQAGIRITEALNNFDTPFRISAARSNALSVVMGGDRTVIGRVANMAHREIVDSPLNKFVVDEDLMRRVETHVKRSKSIGKSNYKGIGERERFIIHEIKGWYELARAEKLLFRQDELKELNKEYDQVINTGGRCLAVAGRQGFGKSALVAEFLAERRRAGGSTYFGRAEEYTSTHQFAVWRDLFSNIYGFEEMNTEERTTLISNKFPHLKESLALLDPILGTRFERTALVESLETRPDDMREMQAEMVADIIRSLSQEDSISTVLLEDMQFFDEDSQRLLMDVLDNIKNTNVFLVITTRPHSPEGTLNLPPEKFDELDNVGKIELNSVLPEIDNDSWNSIKEDWWKAANLCVPLDRIDFDRDESFFKRMFEKIYEKTDGNFRAFQTYLRSWTIYGVQKGYFEAKYKHIDGAPKTVYSIIRDENTNPIRISDEDFKKLGDVSGVETKRFNNLELPRLKNLLSSASVIGQDFSINELIYITDDLSEEEIIGLLEEAKERHFVRHIGGDRYAFVNNETSTAIYKTRSEELDSTLSYQHRLMGQYYREKNPDDLHKIAFHLRHSDDHLAALDVLDELMQQTKKSFSWGAMLDIGKYASRVFGKIQGSGEDWYTIPKWSNEEFAVKEKLKYSETNKLINDEINRQLMASTTMRRFRRIDIMEPVESALHEFENLYDDTGEWPKDKWVTWCNILICKARNHDLLQQTNEANIDFERIFDITNCQFTVDNSSPEKEKNMMSDFFYFYGLHLSKQGQHSSAIDELEKALELGTDDLRKERIRNGIGVRNILIGELAKARQEFETLISMAGGNKNLEKNLMSYWMNLGEIHERSGEFEKAMNCFDKSIQIADEMKDLTGRIGTRANQGFVKKFQGEFEEAFSIYQEVIGQAKRRGVEELVPLCESESVFCLLEMEYDLEAQNAIDKLQGTEFQGRMLTLGAIKKLLLGEDNIDLLEDMFQKGSNEMLEAKIDSLHIAFDNYYFGRKLLSHGYEDMGKKHLLKAKEYYQEHKTLMLIPKINVMLGISE